MKLWNPSLALGMRDEQNTRSDEKHLQRIHTWPGVVHLCCGWLWCISPNVSWVPLKGRLWGSDWIMRALTLSMKQYKFITCGIMVEMRPGVYGESRLSREYFEEYILSMVVSSSPSSLYLSVSCYPDESSLTSPLPSIIRCCLTPGPQRWNHQPWTETFEAMSRNKFSFF